MGAAGADGDRRQHVLDALRRAAARDGVPQDELVDEELGRWFGLRGVGVRAVLDLNVYVSALINPTGTPAQVVRLGLHRRYEIVVCPALLGELAEVLGRDGFRRYFSVDEAAELVGAVAGASDEVDDPATVEPVSRDPDDDYLVALSARRLTGSSPATRTSSRSPSRRCRSCHPASSSPSCWEPDGAAINRENTAAASACMPGRTQP